MPSSGLHVHAAKTLIHHPYKTKISTFKLLTKNKGQCSSAVGCLSSLCEAQHRKQSIIGKLKSESILRKLTDRGDNMQKEYRVVPVRPSPLLCSFAEVFLSSLFYIQKSTQIFLQSQPSTSRQPQTAPPYQCSPCVHAVSGWNIAVAVIIIICCLGRVQFVPSAAGNCCHISTHMLPTRLSWVSLP